MDGITCPLTYPPLRPWLSTPPLSLSLLTPPQPCLSRIVTADWWQSNCDNNTLAQHIHLCYSWNYHQNHFKWRLTKVNIIIIIAIIIIYIFLFITSLHSLLNCCHHQYRHHHHHHHHHHLFHHHPELRNVKFFTQIISFKPRKARKSQQIDTWIVWHRDQ